MAVLFVKVNDTKQYSGTGMEGLPIYDAAHDAFMTLPPHTYRRGVEEWSIKVPVSKTVIAVSARK
jgi:hypothetical protein